MRRTFAHSRFALRLSRRRGRFGIFAPRVAVRQHVSWHWRVLFGLVMSIGLVTMLSLAFDAGQRVAGFDRHASDRDLDVLRDKNAGLEREVRRLLGLSNVSESRLQIEISTTQQLARQVKALEDEVIRLKDDLSVFEGLITANKQGGEVSINRLRVEVDAVNARQYRCRMLLIARGGREVKGMLQLLLEIQQQGHRQIISSPLSAVQGSFQGAVSFKHFYRIDHTFLVPDGASLKKVEVRFLQEGIVKASEVNFLQEK